MKQYGFGAVEHLLYEALPRTQAQIQALELLRQRADSSAQQGHWREAGEHFTRLIQLQPDDPLPYHALAALLAHTDDLGTYVSHCRQALQRFGGAADPVTAQRTALDCLLQAATNIDLAGVARLADRAMASGTNHWAATQFRFTQGLAQYRQGDYAGAIRSMRNVLPGDQAPELAADALLVLAMAHGSLSHTNEALTAFTNGVQIVDTRLPKIENGLLGAGWIEWIVAHSLLREARMLIEDKNLDP